MAKVLGEHARSVSYIVGGLNGRAIGNGVGEGNAELNNVCIGEQRNLVSTGHLSNKQLGEIAYQRLPSPCPGEHWE